MELSESEWVRGEEIGRGSSASVCKGRLLGSRNDVAAPSLMAVKSCNACFSESLKEEKRILDRVGLSPRIIRCFGDGISVENGQSVYNLFLELACEGSLADKIIGFGLAEFDVRRLTRGILEGISAIHERGFVHCDIKPQNILIFEDGSPKISDFGLSKEKDVKISKSQLRGTPLYLAPESVKANEYEAPCDVWALGCVVSEMATGKTAWEHSSNSTLWPLLKRIAKGDEIPNIPPDLSDKGKDFLRMCFIKNPKERWTAQMLLNHPFVADQRRLSNTDAVFADMFPSPQVSNWSFSDRLIPVS